jgi:hypothetical protein
VAAALLSSLALGAAPALALAPASAVAPAVAVRALSDRPAGALATALGADMAAAKRIRLGTLLREGSVRVAVRVPEAGRLTIEWAAPLATARMGMLVATAPRARGTAVFEGPGRQMLAVALTARGRVLLRHRTSAKLSVWAIFQAPGLGVEAVGENFTARR